MSSPQENTYMRGHGIINWNVSKERQFITKEDKLNYEREQAEKKINNIPETQYFKSIKKHFKGNILTKLRKDDSSKPT
jgi:hypothetical protein